MSKTKSFLNQWGPAFLLMGVIFAFSSIPSKDVPYFGFLDYLVKKGGHALGYGLLALAYLHGIRSKNSELTGWQVFLAWVLATIYSALDEFHQSFTPGRTPAITDVMIDSFGAAVAMGMMIKRDRGWSPGGKDAPS